MAGSCCHYCFVAAILIRYQEESFDFLILDVEDHLSRAIDVAFL